MPGKSPTGIFPETLMYPARLGDVLKFLEGLPVPGDEKESLLFGWSRVVGVKLNASQYARVSRSGVGGE